jgi:hypothetical protein
LPGWRGKASEFCARVERELLQRFPSLGYYATVKVFEMVKDDSSTDVRQNDLKS